MRTLLVAVLLTVVQARSPVPRQTANNQTSASTQSEKQANANKNKSSQPLSPSKAVTSQENKDPVQSQPKTNANETITVAKLSPVPVKRDWLDYAGTVSTLLLTLATLVIAVYAAIQARAARQSANNEERAVRLTERADVLVEGVSIVRPQNNPFFADGRVKLKFRNFGRTRANNVKASISVSVPDAVPVSPAPLPLMALAAGSSVNVPFDYFGKWLTKETMQAIIDGDAQLRFDATITYTDVFGLPHTTECGGAWIPSEHVFYMEYNRAT